jgi:transcriptional regulator with XRE-family HTH domain
MEKELEQWYKLHKFYRYTDYLTKDLAIFLGVSPRTIQRWLKGKAKPNKEKLKLIKKYLAKKILEKPSRENLP